MKNSNCLSLNIAILKYLGVWIPDAMSYPWDLLYNIYGFVVQTFFYLFIVMAEVCYVFTVMGDTEKMIDGTVLLFTHLITGIKIFNIWYRQQRIKPLVQLIDGPTFNKSDPAKKAMLERTTKVATTAGQMVTVSVIITIIFWSIVPTLKSEMALPLKTAYPFDTSSNPMYSIMFAYISISTQLMALVDVAGNLLAAGLLVLISAQLDVLSCELDEISTTRSDVTDTHYQKTVLCVKYHQQIIEYVEELAGIFGLPIFCQFITSSIVICLIVFKINISTEPIEVITMVFYLICVFLELFMYCYPGDLLINKSLLVADAAFGIEWTGDVRKQRAQLLMILRAQRSLGITAGGLFRVNLPTAATVIQTSYSYYAVLRQATNK